MSDWKQTKEDRDKTIRSALELVRLGMGLDHSSAWALERATAALEVYALECKNPSKQE